jgi:hypothetical protein
MMQHFSMSPAQRRFYTHLKHVQERHRALLESIEVEFGQSFLEKLSQRVSSLPLFELESFSVLQYPEGPSQKRALSELEEKIILSEAETVNTFLKFGTHDELLARIKGLILENSFKSGERLAAKVSTSPIGIRTGPGLLGAWAAIQMAIYDGNMHSLNSRNAIERVDRLLIHRFHFPYQGFWRRFEDLPLDFMWQMKSEHLFGFISGLVSGVEYVKRSNPLEDQSTDRFKLRELRTG